ncbi:MAG: SulP family inorganic anion transporter, partial [Hyphomicrobiales bacterium]|nr:SulP family inorganic anion transporter [Hyphomicrobiales bacterium]
MAFSFATSSPQARLANFLPFLRWAPLVNGRTTRADLLAGLTGAIVVLPQGVAFATIAGMPPQYGLYASIVPTIVAALFGSSWHLVAGPSTTASLVLAASLATFATPGTPDYVQLAMTLAIMTGLIELALGVFKLGVIVNFISHSVVIGYTAGVGMLIIATQSAKFFGLKVPSSHDFLFAVWQTVEALPTISLTETSVAFATLGAGVAARKFLPRIPYMLPALLVGGLVAAALNYWKPGSAAVVGALPSHLPPLSAPSFDPHTWRILLPTALAVAISALNEVVSIGRALATRTEQDLDINQEFVGQGLANIAAPFFSGYVVSGSFNRSALNYESGARTPLAAMSAGVILLGLLVFAAPLAAYLPKSAMAASLVMIGWGLIDRRSIANIWRMSRAERWVFFITIASALFIHIQMAIFVGVALSLLIFLYRTSVPELRRRVPDPMSASRKFTDVRPDLPECP